MYIDSTKILLFHENEYRLKRMILIRFVYYDKMSK